MPKKRVLYNLTLHKQRNLGMKYNNDQNSTWEIEEEPRLVPVTNPQDWKELKRMVGRAIQGIPPGSAVLIGGMTQIAILIAELNIFELFYIVLDNDYGNYPRAVPVGFDSHQMWTRNQRYSIETTPTTTYHPEINEGDEESNG